MAVAYTMPPYGDILDGVKILQKKKGQKFKTIIGDNCVTKQHEGWTKPSESMSLFCVLKVLLKGTPILLKD